MEGSSTFWTCLFHFLPPTRTLTVFSMRPAVSTTAFITRDCWGADIACFDASSAVKAGRGASQLSCIDYGPVRSVCEGRDVRRRFDAVRSSEMDEVREILVECLSCLLGYRGVCSFAFIQTQSGGTPPKPDIGQTKMMTGSLLYFLLVLSF